MRRGAVRRPNANRPGKGITSMWEHQQLQSMMTGFRNTAAALVIAASVAAGAGSAQAQSGILAGSSFNREAFCVGGRQIGVERFDPTGLANAFCGQRPAVIMLHGADGLSYYGPMYREAACNLAKAGYSTFIVHYFDITPAVAARGAVNPKSIDGSNFLAWQAAVAGAVDYVAGQPGIDSRRVALMGFSLGSYLSVAEGARNPRVAAVVDFFGGLPADAARLVRRMPPTLIIHGEADRTVPLSEALRLRDVAVRVGACHELVVYPGAGHELGERDKADAAARVLSFLRTYL